MIGSYYVYCEVLEIPHFIADIINNNIIISKYLLIIIGDSWITISLVSISSYILQLKKYDETPFYGSTILYNTIIYNKLLILY